MSELEAPFMKRGRRITLRRVAIGCLVGLISIAAGLGYAFRVSGLEVRTPNGVNLIIAREPTGAAPGPAEDAALDAATRLAEENVSDFGYPGYDSDARRVVVNIATSRGRRLFEATSLPSGARLRIRQGAHSVEVLDRVQVQLLDSDDFFSTSADGLNDRIVARSDDVTPGLLTRTEGRFGPDVVAILWDPFAEPPRLA